MKGPLDLEWFVASYLCMVKLILPIISLRIAFTYDNCYHFTFSWEKNHHFLSIGSLLGIIVTCLSTFKEHKSSLVLRQVIILIDCT